MYGSLSNPFRSMASSWGIMSCDRLMRCGLFKVAVTDSGRAFHNLVER